MRNPFFSIFKESFLFAFHALSVNKLRSILSLTGVTIGILTIVTVFTVVDSLERNIRDSLSQLGSNVMYVQKWPFGGGSGEYQWWKYFQRPEPNLQESEMLEKRLSQARYVAYGFSRRETAKNGRNFAEQTSLMAVSHRYQRVWSKEFARGRYFSPMESKSGTPVAVIGANVAEGLFGGSPAVGKEFKILGRKLKVIGVYEREGESFIGDNIDDAVVVPVRFVQKLMNIQNQNNGFIMVVPKEGVSMQAMRDEVTGAMRTIRRLKPKAENNFAVNEISMLSEGLDQVFGVLTLAGGVIGLFSILVGGFGIANIMFVSVKERTNQIGIQKSLGAKNYFILLQFLLESILLCLLGGIIGLSIVALFIAATADFVPFEIRLSVTNIITGLIISVIIGVVAGFIPAYSASRLNPVDAIRSGQ